MIARRDDARQVERGGNALLEKGDGATRVVVGMRGVVVFVGVRVSVQLRVRGRGNREQSEGEDHERKRAGEHALRAADGAGLRAGARHAGVSYSKHVNRRSERRA